MANIHTLRDLNNTPDLAQYSGRPAPNNGTTLYPNAAGMGAANSDVTEDGRWADARCIDLVFPGFKWKSFVLAMCVAETAVFIVSLILQSYALTPSIRSLERLGASQGIPIASGQIWRLVTPLFLHASFWHLLFNVFFQLRMGFPLEDQYGMGIIAILFFATGICGNLFSVALAPCKVAVGASTAAFGFIGLQMAEIALSWHLIQRKEQIIFNMVFFLLMTVFISVVPDSVVDWRGHMGGFIAGFCLGVIFNESMASKPSWYKAGKTAAMGLLIALVVTTTAVIFAIPMSKRGCI